MKTKTNITTIAKGEKIIVPIIEAAIESSLIMALMNIDLTLFKAFFVIPAIAIIMIVATVVKSMIGNSVFSNIAVSMIMLIMLAIAVINGNVCNIVISVTYIMATFSMDDVVKNS